MISASGAGPRWLVEGSAAGARIQATLASWRSVRPSDEPETDLFRIAQEVLTDVARHAVAGHVEVKLESGNGEIRLTIQDDDRGLASAPEARQTARPSPLGMIAIRGRARRAGGDVTRPSRPGEGVLIAVRAPVSGPAVRHTE
jgi:signal transduction histidine kinase